MRARGLFPLGAFAGLLTQRKRFATRFYFWQTFLPHRIRLNSRFPRLVGTLSLASALHRRSETGSIIPKNAPCDEEAIEVPPGTA